MQQGWFVIKHQTCIAKDVYEMDLSGDTTAITAAGQFVNIRIDGCYLRRPISVCAVDTGVLRLIYKVVGAGTTRLSEMQVGEKLDLLSGLGNGYDLSCSGTAPLLIGGGVGVPPLYEAAKRLQATGKVRAMYFIRSNFRRWGARYVWLPRTDRAAPEVL